MMRTDKADHVRRLAAVPMALALALSALVLVSGQALAGKPVPFIGAHGHDCPSLITGRAAEHVAWFDLRSNKGRWAFVEAQFKVGDATWSNYYPADPPTRVETDVLYVRRTVTGPDESTSFRLRLMDRKGVGLTDWTKVDIDC